MSIDKFLIIGANGFLGSRITKLLVKKGYEVIGSYYNQQNYLTNLNKYKNFHLEHLDVNSRQDIKRLFTKYRPNKIINCAAYGVLPSNKDEIKIFDVNLRGAFNLFKEADNFKADIFIQFGSCFEYGNHKGNISEGSFLNPTTFYGITKLACTNLLLDLNKTAHVSLVILRPFGLWGPNESSERLVPQIISSCLSKNNLNLTLGDQIRDYTYVDDLAEWTLEIINLKEFPNGEIVNLGSSRIQLRQFAKSIAKNFNCENLLKFGKLPYRNNEMMELSADNSKLIGLIGKLKKTTIEEGLKIIIEENYN